eukprot:m.80146 g.80146  ORF g.80146 m.80146 type:complete len:160 (+) comp14653_c0_seq1:271-750(+)
MTQQYIPPLNFDLVEPDLYRSAQPNDLSFPFLETLQLKTILFLSPEEPSAQLKQFAEENTINLVHLGKKHVTVSEEMVLEALDIILRLGSFPLLVCCKLGRHHTGTVIGCLRKLQRWNLTSIFEEYRRYGRKVRLINEQFIEFFDVDMVEVPSVVPPWL